MNKLGALLTCYNEIDAVDYAIKSFHTHYPDSKVYLVTESSISYDKFISDNISVNYGHDSMSFYSSSKFANDLPIVFQSDTIQEYIKTAVNIFLDRVIQAIEFCKSDYLILLDPDALVRGKLNIPSNAALLGSLFNKGVPESFKSVLQDVPGAVVFDQWGATPAIFDTKLFLKAYDRFKSIPGLLSEFTQSWYAFYAHDIIIPTLFSLIGIPETKNHDLTECNTDPNWENSGKPLIHHFKRFYPNYKHKFPWFKCESA